MSRWNTIMLQRSLLAAALNPRRFLSAGAHLFVTALPAGTPSRGDAEMKLAVCLFLQVETSLLKAELERCISSGL